MSVLLTKDSRVVVQGFTGKEASFHAEQMIEYGTQVVGGVAPGKGGSIHLGKPVFNSVAEAVREVQADTSAIFVPPAFAADAMLEAIAAGIKLIVAITEGVPTQDMVKVKHALDASESVMIGPNCPGIISPGQAKVGIMPGFVHTPGRVGIISKSGTLTYEAVYQVGEVGLGQSTCIGIGGDPIIGLTTKDAVQLLMKDDDTDAIVVIGEIGGTMEIEAAEWIKENKCKPVVGFIAGQTAPKGKRMGHAGAIVGGAMDTAQAKMAAMRACGIEVADSPADIGKLVKQVLS